MKIFQKLKEIFQALEIYRGSWIVCGGIAATIYRDVPRYTGDIDIAVIDHESGSAIEIAEAVLKKIGYQPIAGFLAGKTGQALVVGREANPEMFIGVDFLLPLNPWVHDAVKRGQVNLLDYGFVSAPTITIEDLYLAKMMAFQDNPERAVDREDIESILRTKHNMNLVYLRAQAAKLGVTIPTGIKNDLLG